MSDLRPRGIPIMVNGEERYLLFTLNAIDEIQDKFGETLGQVLNAITEEEIPGYILRDMLVILLNDEVEREKYRNPECGLKEITELEAGWIIGLDNRLELIAGILKAYGASIPEPEDTDPNQMSGQQSS